MHNRMFGWDLPPGCRLSDIPGNRPEDEAWENIYDNFFNEDRIKNRKYGIKLSEGTSKLMDELYSDPKYSGAIDEYIQMSIEYGMEIAKKETQENILCDEAMYSDYLIGKHLTPIDKKTHQIKEILSLLSFPEKSYEEFKEEFSTRHICGIPYIPYDLAYSSDCPCCEPSFAQWKETCKKFFEEKRIYYYKGFWYTKEQIIKSLLDKKE